jgi:hypothetical protein
VSAVLVEPGCWREVRQPAGMVSLSGRWRVSQHVWMSHGDEAKQLPEGFTVVAKSDQVRTPLGPCCGAGCPSSSPRGRNASVALAAGSEPPRGCRCCERYTVECQ